jgi:hypothetical protein
LADKIICSKTSLVLEYSLRAPLTSLTPLAMLSTGLCLYSKLQTALTQGKTQEDLLGARFDLNLNSVIYDVKTETVRSICDIAKDELVTMHPGDYLKKDRVLCVVERRVNLPEIFYQDTSEIFAARILPYLFDIHEDLAIMGEPLLNDDPNYLGHLITDAMVPKENADKEEYEVKSPADANVTAVIFLGAHVGFIAARDIKAGEIIHAHFTWKYWVNWLDQRKVAMSRVAFKQTLRNFITKVDDNSAPIRQRMEALEVLLGHDVPIPTNPKFRQVFFSYACGTGRKRMAQRLRLMGADNIWETLGDVVAHGSSLAPWVVPYLLCQLPDGANMDSVLITAIKSGDATIFEQILTFAQENASRFHFTYKAYGLHYAAAHENKLKIARLINTLCKTTFMESILTVMVSEMYDMAIIMIKTGWLSQKNYEKLSQHILIKHPNLELYQACLAQFKGADTKFFNEILIYILYNCFTLAHIPIIKDILTRMKELWRMVLQDIITSTLPEDIKLMAMGLKIVADP